jgi:hypothetical protein
VIRIIESAWSDSDNQQPVPVHADRCAEGFRVAAKKLLPEPVTDHRHRVATRQSEPCCVHVIAGDEYTSYCGLRAQDREEIPGCLRNMRPNHAAPATKVRVDVLKNCSVGEI